MAITKKRKATNADEDVDKEEPYLLLVKTASLCGRKNSVQRFLMKQKAEVSHDPAFSFLGIYLKVSVIISQRCIHIHVYDYTINATGNGVSLAICQ